MRDNIECYVRNLITGTNIEFELVPDEFSNSAQAMFEAQAVRGRSSPIQGYDSSGPETVSFTVLLHDEYCKSGILTTVNQLKALTYPEYSGSITPPKCYLRFGKMMSTVALVNSVNVTWMKPYRDGVFLRAEVSLDFTMVTDNPKSATQIEGGYY